VKEILAKGLARPHSQRVERIADVGEIHAFPLAQPATIHNSGVNNLLKRARLFPKLFTTSRQAENTFSRCTRELPGGHASGEMHRL
jgi:hypothetical protein